MALQNVREEADNGEISLKSWESVVLKQGEEIHNEVRASENCGDSVLLVANKVTVCSKYKSPRMVHCLQGSSQSIDIFMPVLPAFVCTVHSEPDSICQIACAWRVHILLIGEGTSLVA